MTPTVSVIIPTTCDARREALLFRAVQSVFDQQNVRIELIVVVNGSRVNDGVFNRLMKYQVGIIRLDEGNVSKARYAGLKASTGEYFCFLDDDDEFLPGALAHRLSLFEDGVDCVVTNGWIRAEVEREAVPDSLTLMANTNPAHAYLIKNWFGAAGSMFRRETSDLETFNMHHKFYEWTLLFFRLLGSGKRIKYDATMTFRKFEDHPMSVSHTHEYHLAQSEFLTELMEIPLAADVLAVFRRKLHTALNAKSQMHLERRQRLDAWRAHLSCLKSGGWRYLPFTRKLIF